MELPRHFRPRRDRAGKQAGTTDDQRLMIVFVVMVFVMTMARATARAVLPWSFKTGEIREISAIARVYTNLSGRTTANPARTGRFFTAAFAPFTAFLQRRDHRVAHRDRADLPAARRRDVAGAVALLEHLFHRALDAIGLLRAVQRVAQQHRG